MTELLLEDNLLTHLPEDLDCLVNLKVLTLVGNPMEEPPVEVCIRGKEAVSAYLKKKKYMKIIATKVKSAKFLDDTLIYSQLLWRGVSVKHSIGYPMGLLFTQP